MQHADQIDHRIGGGNQRRQRRVVMDIGDGQFDSGQQNQVAPPADMPGRDHDAVVLAGKFGNQVLTNEAGSADDENVGIAHIRSLEAQGVETVSKGRSGTLPSKRFSDCGRPSKVAP